MAYGLHWEWRGFGSISTRFAKTFLLLPKFYDNHMMSDIYIWIPGSDINAKFRTGSESGLKFKHLKRKEGNFEVWLEDKKEMYEFPLEQDTWSYLSDLLKKEEIELPNYPSPPPDREMLAHMLKDAGCKIVEVEKERETRILDQSSGTILVEWATIRAPQHITSIGLETYSENPETDISGEEALNTIKNTIPVLNLDKEPLQPMGYLEALNAWVDENKI